MIIHQWRSSKSLEIVTCTSCSTLSLVGKVSAVSGKIETRYRLWECFISSTALTNNCCKEGFLDRIEKKVGDQEICQLINYN